MLTIFVPAGVVGRYRATVSASGERDFQCVVLEDRTNELFCIGPGLPTGTVSISIYHLSDERDSSSLVFEIDYYIVGELLGEPGIPGLPIGS